MKKILILIMLVILAIPIQARAEDKVKLEEAHATAYILKGRTASGCYTRKGICASGNPDWYGKTVAIYQRNENGLGYFLGYYECLDTGCPSNVIDVWCPDMEEAQKFMDRTYENGCKGRIYVQVLDTKG